MMCLFTDDHPITTKHIQQGDDFSSVRAFHILPNIYYQDLQIIICDIFLKKILLKNLISTVDGIGGMQRERRRV